MLADTYTKTTNLFNIKKKPFIHFKQPKKAPELDWDLFHTLKNAINSDVWPFLFN